MARPTPTAQAVPTRGFALLADTVFQGITIAMAIDGKPAILLSRGEAEAELADHLRSCIEVGIDDCDDFVDEVVVMPDGRIALAHDGRPVFNPYAWRGRAWRNA